eukprot:TRINITY_DN29155_c0_g1_i1.p1 TRINITY_DN29155_c0_g1~~TRINITY_DN29155_c0_g1_i1.p1  ORF type:complete len:372 (-),score=86.59 TRINITY_DN29155_c0_g1_i1:246-1361(-)
MAAPSSSPARLREASPAKLRASSAARAPSGSPCSQAALLRQRGELGPSRASFQVRIPRPSPTARPIVDCDPASRIGLALRRSSDVESSRGLAGCRRRSSSASLPAPAELSANNAAARLVVAEVDGNARRRTPVAQWNREEEKQAVRTALERDLSPERHAALIIKAGDRVSAVDDLCGATAMLGAIQDAMDDTNPKTVKLTVSRNLEDVLAPAALSPPSSPENLSTSSEPLKRPLRPPLPTAAVSAPQRSCGAPPLPSAAAAQRFGRTPSASPARRAVASSASSACGSSDESPPSGRSWGGSRPRSGGSLSGCGSDTTASTRASSLAERSSPISAGAKFISGTPSVRDRRARSGSSRGSRALRGSLPLLPLC